VKMLERGETIVPQKHRSHPERSEGSA
jgi:hypothetical protein